MPGRLGPRFALEAAFLILLAVGAGVADLSPTVIVLVMVAAWVIVAVIEFTAERVGTAFPPIRRAYVTPPPVRRRGEDEPVEATVVTPIPAALETAADEKGEAPAPAEAEAPAAPAAETAPEPAPEPGSDVESVPRRRFWQRRDRDGIAERQDGEPVSPPRHVRLLPRRTEPSRAVEEVAEIFDRAENVDDR